MIPFVKVLSDLKTKGETSSPRGLEILELNNYMLDIEYPFSSVKGRNLKVDYIRREFQWYLAGNPYDTRITKHASMWANFIQPDGSIASNYGQYMFGYQDGFSWVTETLRDDPTSRQAIIPFANKENLYFGNQDQVCTLGLVFNIRNNKLNMTVMMRSEDVFKGVGVDWPCFTFFHEMVAVELGLVKGVYTHFVNNLHVYKTDFAKMESILADPEEYVVEYPPITDTYDLISGKYESPFGLWLTEVEL